MQPKRAISLTLTFVVFRLLFPLFKYFCKLFPAIVVFLKMLLPFANFCQQLLMTKRFSSKTRKVASDYGHINGLEQKEAMMDKGMEEVNNNWSIDDGKNDGENGNNSGNN
jgi:hypothetical protein